jgi:pyruvate decarboxylase
MHASYNDIQPWKFQDIPAAFGADSRTYKTFCVRTRGELNDLLHDEDFAEGRILQLVEVHLAKDDAPASMKAVAESASKRNTKT